MKSKLQHTKGPWVKDYNNTVGHIKTLCDPDVHTKTIIKYRYNMCEEILTEEEIEANARLIAAAPEMLEELINFCRYNCSGCPGMTKGCSGTCGSNVKTLLEKITGLTIKEVLSE